MPSSCPGGFVQCSNGQCEPFEALCGEGGIVTVVFPTEVTTEEATTVVHSASPIVDGTTIAPGVSGIPTTTRKPVINEGLTTTATSQLPQATVSPGITGSCPSGFVQCVDGNCEPFEALCGESGVVTVTFPTGASTTMTQAMSSVSAGLATSDSISGIKTTDAETMQTSTTVATTTTLATVTDSSGNEICLKGWEQCADGTCEPFHWMCTEHDTNTAIIG